MPFLPSLKEDANVPDLMGKFPKTTRPLVEYHQALLRGEDSPFTEAEREAMAGFVSSLNQCEY